MLHQYLSKQPESELLRAVIAGHAAELQVAAGSELVSGIEHDDRSGEVAKCHAADAVRYRNALGVLQELRENPGKMSRVRLDVDLPVITELPDHANK